MQGWFQYKAAIFCPELSGVKKMGSYKWKVTEKCTPAGESREGKFTVLGQCVFKITFDRLERISFSNEWQ